MGDTLDENGLTLSTLSEIVADLEDGFKAIYGADINIDPDSPDGQQINIFAQAAIDLREMLADIYSSFDPNEAAGTVLDQRVAINGIERNGATFTRTPVSITVDRALSLVGLDDLPNAIGADVPSGVYTVKDDAGTEFYLLESIDISGAGTESLTFRAADIGAVAVTVNTITIPVTIIAGVTTINNPSGATTQGADEESDASLRTRREKSVANSSTGYLDTIEGNLLDLDGVTTAKVYENTTNTTDGDGIPAHSIWAIVEGGTDADIAESIYATKSAGSGMYGDEEVDITRVNGSIITIKFDRPTDEDLYISFGLDLPGGVFDEDEIKASIVENIIWAFGGDATADTLTAYLKGFNPDYRITSMLVSADGVNYYESVSTSTKKGRFVNDVSRIAIV